MSVRVFAPAKINITLEVGRPRADGLHPLQSAVMFADVGDWIEAAAAETLSLTIDGPFADALPMSDDNLVLRAARALAPGRGAALKLTKNLPVASGIGGGSSDAAAALKALNALWSCELSESDLQHTARSLGSDVAVCVSARTAWMTGAGEHVVEMQAPRLSAVLVNAGAPLATAAVYKAFDAASLGEAFVVTPPPSWSFLEEAAREAARRGNDLAQPASQISPVVGETLALLRAQPETKFAQLSGSGATCFALTANVDDANQLAARLRAQKSDWWIVATNLGAA
ncbi:MAG: 4-(cytidine 5'-diphospho)-2-C-methyl-D-erythritol kinase [Terricaulis sp.]